MQVIIGLGNPGKKYANTRHNIGFMLLDDLAKKMDLPPFSFNKKFNAEIIKTPDLILAKPQTFMNQSGEAVQRILDFYGLLPKHFGILKKKDCDMSDILTVIHDDLDIDLGKYKIAIDSRSAGNKGVGSLISLLKTKKFKRIRIGINNQTRKNIPTENFVLQNFHDSEIDPLTKTLKEILQKEFDL